MRRNSTRRHWASRVDVDHRAAVYEEALGFRRRGEASYRIVQLSRRVGMLDSDRRGTHAGNAGLIAGVVKEEKMSEEINHKRRRFLGATAVTIAAARFGLIGSADAQSDKTNTAKAPPIRPETSASFGALKQIDAGVLNVGYAEDGPAEAPRSFSCTAGPTTFTAMSRWRHCWRRRATG